MGNLVSSGSQISGQVHFIGSSCYLLSDSVLVSGTITAKTNAFSLMSNSVAGQVITLTGFVSADGKIFRPVRTEFLAAVQMVIMEP